MINGQGSSLNNAAVPIRLAGGVLSSLGGTGKAGRAQSWVKRLHSEREANEQRALVKVRNELASSSLQPRTLCVSSVILLTGSYTLFWRTER